VPDLFSGKNYYMNKFNDFTAAIFQPAVASWKIAAHKYLYPTTAGSEHKSK